MSKQTILGITSAIFAAITVLYIAMDMKYGAIGFAIASGIAGFLAGRQQ